MEYKKGVFPPCDQTQKKRTQQKTGFAEYAYGGGAFGVRLLGTALVVILGLTDFRNKGRSGLQLRFKRLVVFNFNLNSLQLNEDRSRNEKHIESRVGAKGAPLENCSRPANCHRSPLWRREYQRR
jgi:hypothetical protein